MLRPTRSNTKLRCSLLPNAQTLTVPVSFPVTPCASRLEPLGQLSMAQWRPYSPSLAFYFVCKKDLSTEKETFVQERFNIPMLLLRFRMPVSSLV